MPTHPVSPQMPASLAPASNVVVMARASHRTEHLVLSVRSPGGGAPPRLPHRLAPGKWLLPQGVDAAELWMSLDDGSAFPAGAQCELRVVAQGDYEDIAQIPDVDLVGKQEALVASVVREPTRIVVSIPNEERTNHTQTAQSAIAHARQVLGVDALGDASRDVWLDVDGSASMRPLAQSGVLAEVIEVIFGVTRVVDPDHRMPFDILVEDGHSSPEVAAEADARVGSRTTRPGELIAKAIAESTTAHTRFRAVRSGGNRGALESGIRFVVTDGPPHDLVDLERLETDDLTPHLVVVCPTEVAKAWSLETSLPVTYVDPAAPASLDVVASLLQSSRPAQPQIS